jgi:hypothetical protein
MNTATKALLGSSPISVVGTGTARAAYFEVILELDIQDIEDIGDGDVHGFDSTPGRKLVGGFAKEGFNVSSG